MNEITNETHCFSKIATVTWKIHEFFTSIQRLDAEKIPSRVFVLNNATFRMEGYMSNEQAEGNSTENRVVNYAVRRPTSSYLAYTVYRSTVSDNSGKYFKVDMLVDNPSSQTLSSAKEVYYSAELMTDWDYLKYHKEGWATNLNVATNILWIPSQTLMDNKGALAPKDTLTVVCDFFCKSFTQDGTPVVIQKAESTSHLDDLSTDMAKLLKEPSTADFIIRIQEKDIPVHSVILCARSSVFKAMLSNEYKEKQKNVVEINDVTSPAMCNFLEYVYTGSLTEPGSMSTDLLMEVYAVADKYNVVKLKDMCAQFLLDKLSEDNMEKFVRIADKHNDHKMLDSIADFVARRQEILDGEKWKRLSENVPTFGFRVLNGVLKRRRLI